MAADRENVYNQDQTVRGRETDGLSIGDLFRIIKKHIILALVVFALTVVTSVAYLVLSPPKYSATVKLFATYSNSLNSTDNLSNINSAVSYISSQIKSYPALVSTDAVLHPVIDKLKLDTTVGAISGQITATNPANTSFIIITATDHDAQLASELANATADSLKQTIEQSLYPGTDGHPSPVTISIVQKANTPTTPSSPKTTMVLGMGIIAGLILGMLAALLRDLCTTKIQDEDELSAYINVPVIGRVPQDEALTKSAPIVVSEATSPVAEDFRRIRTNLNFASPVEGTQSRFIVISSVGASEGKTTNSINIASALAENGASVLLIDADLRHPSIAKHLGIDNSAGLTHVLSGQASVKDVIQPYWKRNFHVLPAGPKPPNASTLLNSQIMRELIRKALDTYDYVLLDTAPLVVANDAAVFARMGGNLALVVMRDVTNKHDMKETASELQNMEVEPIGFIFNCAKMNKKALEKSSYYYYAKPGQDRK